MIAIFCGANCQPINFEKGELHNAGGRYFKIEELDRKTIHDGKRIQLVGYFSDRWSQRGQEVTLILEDERNNYDSMIFGIKLNEGQRKNEIFLGKTGASEAVGSNQVRGSQMQRDEFIVENMRVYDNDGNPHSINQKFAVSGTVEYHRNSSGSYSTYQDTVRIATYSWLFKDIRIDVAEN